MALDEKALRKPSFSAGYKVALADGQEWTLPRPRIRFKPIIVDGKVEVTGAPSFGPEFDEALDVLFGVKAVEPIELYDLNSRWRSGSCRRITTSRAKTSPI